MLDQLRCRQVEIPPQERSWLMSYLPSLDHIAERGVSDAQGEKAAVRVGGLMPSPGISACASDLERTMHASRRGPQVTFLEAEPHAARLRTPTTAI